jgi:hypothetical protein
MLSRLPPLGSLLWPLILSVQTALCAEYTTTNNETPKDNNQNCSCYVVNSGADSNSPQYFQYYRFYDFRNLADRPGQYLDTPDVVNDTRNADVQPVWNANILDSDAFNADWSIQNRTKDASNDFGTEMVVSPANIYIQQNNDSNNPFTYLSLRTTRLDEFQTTSEMESLQKNLMHTSMRMSGRVIGAKGAVAGFFTYFDDDNESDIEILTNDPTDVIRYTNQPSVDEDGNQVEASSLERNKLPSWDKWQTHRIDWLDKNSYWYLNGDQTAANSYGIPKKPSGLIVNMWSDGGEWSGNMTVGESAEFQIQWIEMAFNTSGPVEGPADKPQKRGLDTLEKREDGCKVVCKIDDVKTMGTPEVISQSIPKSIATGMAVSWGLLSFVGVISLLVGW